MTSPLINLSSPLVGKDGRVIPPWNSFFQQFTQKAPAVVDVTLPSPFIPNAVGHVIIIGAATITLTRGTVNIILTGQVIIPMGIGDILSWTGSPTVQFLE
jgi:hypothetical protein